MGGRGNGPGEVTDPQAHTSGPCSGRSLDWASSRVGSGRLVGSDPAGGSPLWETRQTVSPSSPVSSPIKREWRPGLAYPWGGVRARPAHRSGIVQAPTAPCARPGEPGGEAAQSAPEDPVLACSERGGRH